MHKLLEKQEIDLITERMFHELIERLGEQSPVLIGIQTRGVYLAKRFLNFFEKRNVSCAFGIVDITFHRDDAALSVRVPKVKGTQLKVDINDRVVVLFDDVIHTGRTIRAALDEIMDFGRPSKIILVVLVDRNRRELPIQPDILGKFVPTRKDERIYVKFAEYDGEDGVFIGAGSAGGTHNSGIRGAGSAGGTHNSSIRGAGSAGGTHNSNTQGGKEE